MNIVKKLSIVFIMVILTICIATNKTYAALNCNVNLSTTKNKVTYGEQFSVNVAISNLQTTNGIIAIGAVVTYDTESLTLVDDIEGQNKWSDPFYNSSNGKITSFKSKLSTKNENVFKITFKVNAKGKAKNSAWVKISNFEISDGEEERNCGGSSIKITIEDKENTNTGNNNQGSNNQGSNNQGSNNQGSNNQGSNNQGSNNQTSNNTKKPENNQTIKPSEGTTNPVKSSTNETTVENISTNNEDTNSIENVVGEDSTNSESETNNVQNVFEDNVEKSRENKTINKGLFYTISIIGVGVIIVILFVIAKYWRTK